MVASRTGIELTTAATVVPPDTRDSQDAPTTAPVDPPKSTTAIIITCVTCVTMIGSLLNGVVTIALPTMARDLQLQPGLLLWYKVSCPWSTTEANHPRPASIYALTCGCTLILCGAVADIIGSRIMYLMGCLLQSAFTLACGLSKSGFQLIFFRALAGIAISFCLPSAVSLITTYFPHGRRRNFAFAAMGGGQPIGFSIGLTLGGVLVDGPGWRVCFYIGAAINTVVLFIAAWGLPRTKQQNSISWQRLKHEVDWTGAVILSTSLGMFSYVLAALTGSVSTIRDPSTIALLSLAAALIPLFIFWVGRQENLGRPAIIPNSLWRNKNFTSICIDVFLIWGSFNAVETLVTFYFQDVQELSATQSSLRFLPAPVVGTLTNICIGLIVHRIRANWAVIITTAISALAPLLIALAKPESSYWQYAFPAMALNPIGPDVLFTISNLLISSAFPDKTQALAGGVFNTLAQVGKSVGLALTAVIAGTVTLRAEHGEKPRTEPEALMEGYRAAWWFCLAITAATLVVSTFGLRNVGKLGLKRE